MYVFLSFSFLSIVFSKKYKKITPSSAWGIRITYQLSFDNLIGTIKLTISSA